MRSLGLVLALTCVGAGPTGLTAPAPPAPLPQQASSPSSSYERWAPPTTLDPAERALLHAVRAWGHRRGTDFAYDWRLGRAAATLLPWARAHAGAALPLAQLRQAAWHEGWTDGELAAVAVTTHRGSLRRALTAQLGALLPDDVILDQVGLAAEVGVHPDDHALDRHSVVLAFSRRAVRLGPVAARVPVGSRLPLGGRVVATPLHGLSLAVTCPDGTARRLPLASENAQFAATLDVGDVPGTLQVQLSVDRGQGPEVAASFPVTVVAAPPTGAPGTPGALGPLGATSDVDNAGASEPSASEAGTAAGPAAPTHPSSLLSLVYGLREAHGLDLPVPTPGLMQVARAHAADMVTHHFFAHVSRRTGDVTQRMARAHQPFLHVVENLAEGTDADAMFAQWLQSPSHRLNLLDPHVDAIGVATRPRGRGGASVAVLVMATLAPSAS